MNQTQSLLIVDDEKIVRETLEALLYQEGYNLHFAANGPEALSMLNQVKPDVILLDIMMPGMSGLQVCRHIKANDLWRHIPIILVTALDSKEDLAEGLESGADDFLSKPANGLELRSRVRSMLRVKSQFDELQQTLRLREDLASMLVHDMRNPLSSIAGYSDYLTMANLVKPEGEMGLEIIGNEARRLLGYTNDLLMLAKVEHGQPILHLTTTDICQVAKKAVNGNRIIANLKQVNLHLDLPDEVEELSLDATLFQRVLDNLLSNSLKFSQPHSSVTLRIEFPKIETKSPGPHLRIQVIDEGPGIPDEAKERVFNKFEVVNLKNQNVSQVGLGLAFSKMVVEAHWGRIFVSDNQPTGTIFTVEI
jgi:signal transduction histidine kinase